MGGQSSVERNLGDSFPDGEKFFGLENVTALCLILLRRGV